jgi:hypothetical protein
MTIRDDQQEIGAAVHDAVGMLMSNLDVNFTATPIDVMTKDGIRRAYVLVTLNDDVVREFEGGVEAVVREEKRRREGGQ